MTERTFRIESGASSDGLRLHITDEPSGVTLMSVTLTAQEAWDLFRGYSLEAKGKQTDHLDRVGRDMVVDTLEVPGSILFDVQYGDRVKVSEQWARETAPGWETYEGRRTNTGGVRVITRKWVTDHTNTDARNAAAGLYGSVEG